MDVVIRGVQSWYEAIEEEARRIGGVLAGSFDDSERLRTYTYSVREIIRNVFEHSQADECFICGQRWYGGQVEVAIVDEGVGIARTLSRTHDFFFDDEALPLAVRPGVSRTAGLSEVENIYDNSGYGLYVLSELAASFGWFALGSGTAMLVGRKQERLIEPCSFEGTFFGLRLNSTPSNFQSVLRDIIDVGEAEALASGAKARASGRSRVAR
ncbi:ATP-binding protein [Herbaspirillum sp. C7C8]|uniref:ATP-binding protein n=1 Tax=Herbaspirillum sp. C7C8 TaxID=2736665 RepID=UPI001F523C6D|nr:ATP-binding protein [Herbaspirillum sp. C7C8]